MTFAKLRAPIVLVHGLLGYDELRLCGWTVARYFPNIPERLTEAGNRVLIARVSPTSGVADRAAQLKALIEQNLPGEPVHLIGHSMGGLDCRYLVSKLGLRDRVLTLTTIGMRVSPRPRRRPIATTCSPSKTANTPASGSSVAARASTTASLV